MDFVVGMAAAVNGAVLVAAGLGGLDLARRGGFRPAEIGMALVALGQLAGAAETPGWGWLLRTGASLVVIYTMWQTGRLVVGLREREPHPLAPSPAHADVRSRERGEGTARVRAVASWPGRRR